MAAVEQEITDKCSALHASANLWDDGVITPEQTREVDINPYNSNILISFSNQ